MKTVSSLLRPLVALLVGLGLVGVAVPPAWSAPWPPAPTTANHYIANLAGATAGPLRTGFTIFDTGGSLREVKALPHGVKALVWLGEKCPTPADREFRRTVRRLADSRRVFGYFLSDEPHIAYCANGPAALATRTAFIREVSEGKQKSFIVLSDREDYRPFRPAATGVSMVGINPYPCSVAHPSCAIRKIDRAVRRARARGIHLGRIAPVYQAFGQRHARYEYYNLPSPKQERAMIARWASLVPDPKMDFTYGWGNQDSANPTLIDSARLRKVFRTYFAG